MEIKVKDKGGKDITVTMKNVKNKHVEELMNVLKGMKDAKEDQAIIKLAELTEVRNKIARGLIGYTPEQWGELDVDDAEKFTSIVAEKTFGDLDFSRLFKKRQG